jgi:hypothetical protein
MTRRILLLSGALVIALAIGSALPLSAEQTTTINTGVMRPGTSPPNFAFTLTGDGSVAAWRVVPNPTICMNTRITWIMAREQPRMSMPL